MVFYGRRWLRCGAVAAALWVILCTGAFADGMLIPVGETVGVRIDVEGVLVAGISDVETVCGSCSPAADAGIRAGDIISAVDGKAVDSAQELSALTASGEKGLSLTVKRGETQRTVKIVPAKSSQGELRLGLWLRDGVAGIGTVTYIDPDTGAFGALGHGINDTETGSCLSVDEGSVFRASVVDVKKGCAGHPGELSGSFEQRDVIGTVEANTEHGIFGVMERQFYGGRTAVPVADEGQIVSGSAVILACVSGCEAEAYDVEIIKTGLSSGSGRDLMIRVTDPALLSATGGIVQGMSGSPILQNGKLVGAVTHVLVNDPTRGYGIFIGNMLRTADNTMAA